MQRLLIEVALEGNDWIHEIKHDGYRTQLVIAAIHLRAFTRRSSDWSRKYAPVISAARDLAGKSAIIDGEMTVLDAEASRIFRLSASVLGFTNPPIGEALAFDHGEQLVVAFGVGDIERVVRRDKSRCKRTKSVLSLAPSGPLNVG